MSSDSDAVPLAFVEVSKQFGGNGLGSLMRSAVGRRDGPAVGMLAVDRVSLEVSRGEVLGVIGPNGAGKSTLLRIAAGITPPTSGSTRVAGKPAAMIELGLSFHPDLTGRENLPVAAALLGLSADRLEAIEDEMIEFSGLRPYLDMPVKHFSTGMVARLGFALATHAEAAVLLVDEVLAVGDRSFQQRCIERVRMLSAAGTSVMFVSHSLDLVCQICDRAVRLEAGRVVDDGPALDVVERYARGEKIHRRATTQPARIMAADLRSSTIGTGELLHARCTVDVREPGRALSLRSEFVVPPQPSGIRCVDRADPETLRAAGRWELSADLGPIPTTSGRINLVLRLVETEDGTESVVDQRVLPFEVLGENVGVVRVAVNGTWHAAPSEQVPVARPRGSAPTAPILVCESISKEFRTRGRPSLTALHGRLEGRLLRALDDVSFSVDRGESVGVIGPNGAGKSTLLRVIAGVTDPTGGRVTRHGRLTAVLELGAGFHGDLTGNENLEFTWRLNGGTASGWPRARQAIAEFAAIGDRLDDPVKLYSTGMRARLALALALELSPELLIIDEALSVGDLDFRERVRDRLTRELAAGTALLFASHDVHLLSLICERVLRLDEGRLADDGPTSEVIASGGGVGWSGGERIAHGGVLVRDLRAGSGRVEAGAPFEVDFELEVLRPDPAVYLEFSLREHLDDRERQRARTEEEIMGKTMSLERISGIGDALAAPGRYRVTGRIGGLPAVNVHDVVITAIDGIHAAVISEQWVPVSFGGVGDHPVEFHVAWESEQRGRVS